MMTSDKSLQGSLHEAFRNAVSRIRVTDVQTYVGVMFKVCQFVSARVEHATGNQVITNE